MPAGRRQEEQGENPQAQSWRTVHPTDPIVCGEEWPVTGNRLHQPSRAQLFHVRTLLVTNPTLIRESALTYARLPPSRTGARDRGPENGHKWARPICRPIRHLRVTVDCGSSIPDGKVRRKERGVAVGQVCGWANVGRGNGRSTAEWLETRRFVAPKSTTGYFLIRMAPRYQFL